jgi:type IV pilus assembly protein PilV
MQLTHYFIMKNQKGYSLLEVLITLMIMSYGLLGIAGIIINSLKNNQSSYSRSQAILLANDIIDRMRANKTTAESSSTPYNLALTASPSGNLIPLSDLTEWRESLAGTLPSGTGSVFFDSSSKKTTVIIQWDDSRSSGDKLNISDRVTVGLTNQQIKVETRL